MMSPGDRVNVESTLHKLCLRRPLDLESARVVRILNDAVRAAHGGRCTALLIDVTRGSVRALVSCHGGRSAVVKLSKRIVDLYKGGMSDRERAVRTAFE